MYVVFIDGLKVEGEGDAVKGLCVDTFYQKDSEGGLVGVMDLGEGILV